MTGDDMYVAALILAGALLGSVLALVRLRSPARALVRVNFRGREVPAVLGTPVALAGLAGVGVVTLADAAEWREGTGSDLLLAAVVLLTAFAIAGVWDDRKGDERPRGFKGHLGALKTGRVTGGLVKLLSGGVAGLVAGWLVFGDVLPAVQTGLIVALAANLINLFDRAPGRAGKICLLLGVPLLIWGHEGWALVSAACLGALAGVLPLDLRERGMLGDAGSNPLGAMLGLGLAVSGGPGSRWLIAAVLLVLNAVSERWSFSAIIRSVPLLDRADKLGRQA